MDKPQEMPVPKKHKLPFRGSLAWKLFGSVLLCLVLLLVFNWFLNTFVLDSYYQQAKRNGLAEGFFLLEDTYNTNGSQVEDTLIGLYTEQNISTAIINGLHIYRYGWFGSDETDEWANAFMYTPGTYRISHSDKTEAGGAYITLTGRLTNGLPVMMRTPLSSIKESVAIVNQFLIISGVATILLSVVLVVLVARSFSRPIRELSRVAGSVAQLHFDDRYTRGGSDELADLGNSINSMAASLEATISDLKTANVQLAGDVEKKTRQDEARRAFIANVSHELKTPISLIQTYAEGLREDIASDAGSREFYCSVIEDEAQKMSELLKKMTALMQLEAGSEQLVIERFDVAEMLRNLLLKNQPRFEQKQVAMPQPPAGPLYVWADAYLIENVLTNYLSNALNHVDTGGTVAIFTQPEENRLRIAVYNSGSHIPTEDLPRIWESFYKVDKARTRAYGGTGIGLSVVAAIMKAHRMPYGVYNRQSAAGPGVEFYIELETR